MATVPDILPDKTLSRFEAQRALGLFGPHDVVMLVLLIGSWVVLGQFALWSYLYGHTLTLAVVIGWSLVNIVLAQLWMVVLLYRVLVWILDLNAEIALLPEAAARIAVGFLQGKPAQQTRPVTR